MARWARRVIARRRSERDARIGAARDHVGRLAQRITVIAAAVYGSTARGDFNVWSDVDVLVIAQDLPERAPDRSGVLLEDAPPGVQVVGWTPEELAREHARGNPIAREIPEHGVVLLGEEVFAALVARRPERPARDVR